MTKEKIGYKVSVYSWSEEYPDYFTFYDMSREEVVAWINNLIDDPSSDIAYIVLKEFKIADYD